MVLIQGCIFERVRLTAKSLHCGDGHVRSLWAFHRASPFHAFPTLTEEAQDSDLPLTAWLSLPHSLQVTHAGDLMFAA